MFVGGAAVVSRRCVLVKGGASSKTEGHVRSGFASESTGSTMADYKGIVF